MTSKAAYQHVRAAKDHEKLGEYARALKCYDAALLHLNEYLGNVEKSHVRKACLIYKEKVQAARDIVKGYDDDLQVFLNPPGPAAVRSTANGQSARGSSSATLGSSNFFHNVPISNKEHPRGSSATFGSSSTFPNVPISKGEHPRGSSAMFGPSSLRDIPATSGQLTHENSSVFWKPRAIGRSPLGSPRGVPPEPAVQRRPFRDLSLENNRPRSAGAAPRRLASSSSGSFPEALKPSCLQEKERRDAALKQFEGADLELAKLLLNDTRAESPEVRWDDIIGHGRAKHELWCAVELPSIIPFLFQGINKPSKGVLLFGPPGTGKTMLAKALATESGTTFFSVSAATLASMWRGESERMVRALFKLARVLAPSTIFIDEVDSLCTSRGAPGEHESSRKVKSELLVQIDGMHKASLATNGTVSTDGNKLKRVLVVAATNFPWDLDEALLRRMEQRVYVPLLREPDRAALFKYNMQTIPPIQLSTDVSFQVLAEKTAGYSSDDITNICKSVTLIYAKKMTYGLPAQEKHRLLENLNGHLDVTMADFKEVLKTRKSSVSSEAAEKHNRWHSEFGAH